MTPNTPSLTGDYFSVVQINTQLNSALDENTVKETSIEAESLKSEIDSLKSTISQQKSELIGITNIQTRTELEQKIKTNVDKLSTLNTQYNTAVKSLINIASNNSSVIVSPKYRIRGFFPIPSAKYINNDPSLQKQEIIGFEIAYRYLRLDNTGNPLKTFTYTDSSTGEKITGVYSDWIVYNSKYKEKVFDNDLGVYVWKEEQTSNGEDININQVDISIQKGEKVEIKIRSISEAGYPYNPLKSEWSNSVIIDFPANLSSSSQITNILTDAQNEQTNIIINETLNSDGLIAHINDSIPNPNSVDNIYYKHQAKYLACSKTITDPSSGAITVISTNIQDVLDEIIKKLNQLTVA